MRKFTKLDILVQSAAVTRDAEECFQIFIYFLTPTMPVYTV